MLCNGLNLIAQAMFHDDNDVESSVVLLIQRKFIQTLLMKDAPHKGRQMTNKMNYFPCYLSNQK